MLQETSGGQSGPKQTALQSSSEWRARGRVAFSLRQDVHGGIWLVLRDDRALGDPRKIQNPESRSMWNDTNAACVFSTTARGGSQQRGKEKIVSAVDEAIPPRRHSLLIPLTVRLAIGSRFWLRGFPEYPLP